MLSVHRWVGLIAVFALVAQSGFAVTVESWSASTATEFARGTLDGTSLDEQGRVRLSPALETFWGPEAGIVWAVRPAGPKAAFVALSGPARVLRVAAGSQPEEWYETEEEALITALVEDGRGGVLFGISPEGLVMRASRQDTGRIDVEPFTQVDARFVWALARDADGSIWIGTGLPGGLFRSDPEGRTERVFEAGDDPVRCVTPLPGGGAILGTGGRGRVIRIGEDDRPFVLYDADEAEIVAVRADGDGNVFALAAERSKQPGRSGARDEQARRDASNSVQVIATPPPDEPPNEQPEQEPQPPAEPKPPPTRSAGLVTRPGGALYRIDADGSSRRIWQTEQEMPFAMVLAAGDRLLVSTGDAGRVHAMDREGRSAELLRIPSDQASAMSRLDDGTVLIGGTSDARVELLGPGPRAEGRYSSPPIDAGSVADWGRLRWQAERPRGTRVAVEVRSGNTAEPDGTWAPWVELDSDPGTNGVDTDLPAARWFQARFTLSSRSQASPLLRQVEIAYQPRNRPPVVEELLVQPAGVVWLKSPAQTSFYVGPLVAEDPVARKVSSEFQRGRRRAAPLRKAYEPGARTFAWQATDPDEDRLRYTLEIGRDGTQDWFTLAQDLTDEFYSWDARGMPDGLYRVRLKVDDALDNPNGTHRRAARVSDAFPVDNSRPSVGQFEVRRSEREYEIRFVARDTGGSLAALEIALDGGEWTPLSPVDGVADSEVERYRFVVPRDAGSGSGEHELIVRAIDAAGNLGGEMWRVKPD